ETYPGSSYRGEDIAHCTSFLPEDLGVQIFPFRLFPILDSGPGLGASDGRASYHLAIKVSDHQAGNLLRLRPFDAEVGGQLFWPHGPITAQAAVVGLGGLVLRNNNYARFPRAGT